MVEGDIHKAKITQPLLRGSLPRERLFRLLDAGRDRPVTWVSGPPGSGKTTLVSGYLASRKLPCLWYRVDKGDADPATFFHYLGIATQAAHPRKRKPLPGPALSDPEGIGLFARRYFGELFDRIGSRPVLVFDEWENAIPGSPVEAAVREGIQVFPKGFRAIFVSRSEPSPDFVREVDSRRLESLGWKELRLTPEETAEIARIQRRDASPETIRYLHGRAGGWATGVVLLLERAQRDGIQPQHIGRQTPEEIVEYLGVDMFRNFDAETRAFLVRAAFLPRMTAGTAEALTGHPRASRILSHLNRHNLFTELHPGTEPVYEFHSLFREFLLHHAEGDLSPEEANATRQRAAALLEESGETAEAIDLLRQCGDFRGVCRAIRKEAPSLVRQGRSHTLGDWIISLPKEFRDGDAWLLYWAGICSRIRKPAESRAAFERAFDLFSRAGEETGAFLSWSGVVDTILFQWDDFKSLDRWIDWLDRRVAEGVAFPSVEVEARVCVAMATALVFRRPQHPEIAEWVRRAARLSRHASDPETRLHASVANSNYCLWIGDRAGNDLAMEALRGMARTPGTPPPLALSAKWLEAVTAVCSEGDADASLRLVEEGFGISDATGIRGWDFLLNATGACAALDKGDDRAARKFLGRMAGMLSPARRHGYCQYHYIAAWAHLSRGETLQAGPHAEEAVSVAVETGMYFPEVLCRLALAHVRHEKGETEGAREELDRALSLAVSGRSRILEFMALLSKAQFLLDQGNEHGGLESLRRAMAIGRERHYLSLFWWWRPKAMARLCLKALEAGIEPGYVLDLVRKRGLSPDVPPMEIAEWPWKVRIHTLGRFGVVRDGKRVGSPGKAQEKPLLLLKALIALGGRDVPRDTLADALWPDADGDRALQSLAVNVRRLRGLLGDEKAVLVSEGRVTLSNRVCRVDCWAFERIFSRAERARRDEPEAGVPRLSTALFEKALGLYEGGFLEEERDRSWAVTLRERLRSKFLRSVMEAGRSREAAGEWEAALSCYRKGLEADVLHEEFHRRKMICLHRLGLRSEAEAAYQRCRRTLRAGLGVAPSAETEAVLKSVREEGGKPPKPAR